MFSQTKNVNRIIDANANRLKEGLRVCEEITRFIVESPSLSLHLKKTRHEIDRIFKSLSQDKRSAFLKERDTLGDIGKKMHAKELNRRNVQDIFFANIQRAKESARVLEEFSKLNNKNIALRFKKIRYDIYEVEKKTAEKIPSLFNHR